MSRAEPKINLILDEMVRVLQGIDGNPDQFLTTIKTATRWAKNPLALTLPALIVRCARWGPNEPQCGEQHNGQAVIEVRVLTKFGESVDDPSRELHRMVSDVLYAIENDWQLANSGVASLQIHVIDGYEPAESLDTASGLAETVVGFRALWPWDAANP